MARRKKRRKRPLCENRAVEKRSPFNPLLSHPETLKEHLSEPLEKEGIAESNTVVEKEPEPTEDEIFLQAVGDVKPLADKKRRVPVYPDPSLRPAHPAPNEELEAVTHLWELIHGSGEMDITFSDEYIEGSVRGFDRKLMRRLRKGEFPVQDHLDLHGLTKKDAEIRVRDFLMRSHSMGLRCVLVIHGRGLNSEDHIPVLKERIPVWLSRGPVRKFVLAFSTARPYDGGTGAIYILLRRKKGKPYLRP
ncbi:MAG: Smr/MutS family protein [Deltaproteobacteria bacterium]|nr:Smr/MutS family protein [Deltaproteobacteria bacterium]MBW1928755.1 Smr/MutS family protein [Deltaproteobacteria bacterium]MBW2025006.1 Smr/MutS family protein [Deltaproteobacteria bacterium]MBW2124127.1 Smr/MutS family protein [Deltaproteobacteria bacterium]RLB18780.1 MAG: DNA mismatch repair protein MutS [Deltaproteobacteria bacterium]